MMSCRFDHKTYHYNLGGVLQRLMVINLPGALQRLYIRSSMLVLAKTFCNLRRSLIALLVLLRTLFKRSLKVDLESRMTLRCF